MIARFNMSVKSPTNMSLSQDGEPKTEYDESISPMLGL